MKVVITGGSSGIGRMIAEHLRCANDVVILSGTEASVGKAAKDMEITGYAADVANYRAVEKAFKKIGPFDALINCAGILGPIGPLQDTNISLWEQTIKVNLMGTVNCCKAGIPLLQAGRRGKILNLSGGGSAFPRLYHSAYACSKAAAVRFTENLAKDLIRDGMRIDVNIIAPGAHKTGIWSAETLEKEPATWADKDALMKLADYLLSERSDGVSGKFLNIKDDYARLDKLVTESDLFTLRRIDNYKYKSID
jgi:NAD(P)-dependent dehydrogenase (short-subunit alcohol dehydrogenase family)